jgi:myosin-5
MASSKNKVIQEIFLEEVRDLNKKSNDKSLSQKIQKEMKELMTELRTGDVHFVRCIKPNEEKKPSIFNQFNSLNQIRYLGVLETLKIRKEGYSVRRVYERFYQQYGEMTSNPSYPTLASQRANFKTLVMNLFKEFFPHLDENFVLWGKT